MRNSARYLAHILPTIAIIIICQSYQVSLAAKTGKHNSTMLKGNSQDVSYEITGTKGTRQPCSGSNCSKTFDSLPATIGERGTPILEANVPLKESGACVIQGTINIRHNWYGYLAQLQLVPEGGKVYFKFSYPKVGCCLKMLIYLTEQYNHLRAPMNCLQKQAVLDPKSPQVITLSPTAKHSGCKAVINDEGTEMLECKSGRILRSDIVRTWHIAVSNCGSPSGLLFDYSLIVFGNLGECPQSKTSSSIQLYCNSSLVMFLLIIITLLSNWN